jgi:hypothetical protein
VTAAPLPGRATAWPDARLLYVFAALLTVAAVVYLGKGYAGVWLKPDLSDMGHRTIGLDYIRAGITPYSPARDAGWDAPWGWLGNALTYWPRPPWTRPYYGLMMFGTIALMVAWAYQAGARSSRAGGVLLAAATLAISSICTVLGLGQNALFIVGALVASLMLAERGHRVLAGICLGFALAKPQIAAPFVLPFLCQGQFVVLVAAAGYLVSATVLVGWAVGLSPLAFIEGWMSFISDSPRWPGYGPYQLLMDAGVAQSTALFSTAIVVAAAGAVLIYLLRRRSLALLFALAAVTARMWSYHQLYDNAMLVFLLVATAVVADQRRDRVSVTTFLAVGLTLWIPGRACDLYAVQMLQMAVWLVGAAVIAWSPDVAPENSIASR